MAILLNLIFTIVVGVVAGTFLFAGIEERVGPFLVWGFLVLVLAIVNLFFIFNLHITFGGPQ